ncbi:class I SAM-dependent methyltransferase [Dermabacter vaginalis]|uniref:class I SAM-dependent methyltransferase n=1 Tax=Dermabacter vaginalis TaxID=1630135 RepID=UPI0021A90A84|nr:class I SAM-dependent methyltransferase [Dermabacter vaginalis]MCT2149239.1 class I SAM-dependent methyltransferase [Dermabacter vaginalis]
MIFAPEENADALDRLIVHDAAENAPNVPGDILVLDDRSGALTAWACARIEGRSRVFVRSVLRSHAASARAIAARSGKSDDRVLIAGDNLAAPDLGTFLAEHSFSGSLALGRLPKSLAALEENARFLARHAHTMDREMTLVLGGATKHMTRSMNDALRAGFGEVRGLRGKGKFRSLYASVPGEGVAPPLARRSAWSSGELVAYGGVFSGAKADRGGEALARVATTWIATATERGIASPRVLDLGCGNGMLSLAVSEAAARTGAALSLTATDVDLDAVRSTHATLAPYSWQPGIDVRVTWDDAAAQEASESFDLVMLNPPFHDGTRVDATLVEPLLEAAHRVLEPGGELLLVHNSHLRYRALLERRFSATREVSRDRTFTVLSATKAISKRER